MSDTRTTSIHERRGRRRARIRSRVTGTAARPRLSVFRSHKHIYAQLIDDVAGQTLAAASSATSATGTKTDRSTELGKAIAAAAAKAGIATVVFDRGGYKYHGRVKALADAAREAGLQF
ncbi:MAG: 50S ribosomal protein L18 [Candidatus Doudnabacteria bacterium]|nr:50S ribosomal protein L18 [Candidatus Doudnabacteria bacterium]